MDIFRLDLECLYRREELGKAYRPKQAPELQAASIACASAFVTSVVRGSKRGFNGASTRPVE